MIRHGDSSVTRALTAVRRDVLSGRAAARVIWRQRRVDLLVDEGVEADIRAPAQAALAHRAVVLPQEIIHLPCNGDKEEVCVICSPVD